MNRIGVSIVIPAHNEAERIGATLKNYTEYFANNCPYAYEIIVVLNACQDNTLEIVNRFAGNDHKIVVVDIPEKGKGNALKLGFKSAKFEVIGFTDADGATGPAEILRLVENLDGNDGAIGSRWLPESNVVHKQNLARRISSRGLNVMVRTMFSIPFADTQCGAKVFKKTALNMVIEDVASPGFTFDIELLQRMLARRLKIKEIAITWEDKSDSKVNLLRVVPQMARSLFDLWINSAQPVQINSEPLQTFAIAKSEAVYDRIE